MPPDGWHAVEHLQAQGMRLAGLRLAVPPSTAPWYEDPPAQPLPAQLAGMTQIDELSLAHIHISGGWQHLPRQFRRLDLSGCRLGQETAQLAGMTQLSKLCLARCQDVGHLLPELLFEILPQQLQSLDLSSLGFYWVPAAVSALTALTALSLGHNTLLGDFNHLCLLTRLQDLSLHTNDLSKVPAVVAALTQLSKLDLSSNFRYSTSYFSSIWEDPALWLLPQQLQSLDLHNCEFFYSGVGGAER